MKKILIVINIAVTWRWGISAMIFGMMGTSIISYYLNSYYTGILIDYSIWEQLRDLFSYLIMSVFMGMGVYGVGLISYPSIYAMLLAQIGTGIVVYVSLCWFFRLEAFMELGQLALAKMRLLKSIAQQ